VDKSGEGRSVGNRSERAKDRPVENSNSKKFKGKRVVMYDEVAPKPNYSRGGEDILTAC